MALIFGLNIWINIWKLSGFLQVYFTLLRNAPESFRGSPAARSTAITHGLCEILASTDHPIYSLELLRI